MVVHSRVHEFLGKGNFSEESTRYKSVWDGEASQG